MIRQISARNTITLPKEILERIGVGIGDFWEISEDGRQIILAPKVLESPFSDEEWEKLELLVKEEGTIYSNAENAKAHLGRLNS